ncbi:MAG TPA: hypothetical protein VGS07_33685 [Thermoanaerobaculia bacterium]|nr:hypothetical protein [Thermoanaerobaculia bacterium]
MTDWTPVDLLPGLWLGLLGTLLAAALRRWYDPVPGKVLAVFAVVLLVLFGPVLFGGKILLPLDGLREHVPFQGLAPTRSHSHPFQRDLIRTVVPAQSAARAAWDDGRWPLWNRRVGAGMPLLADPQAQALQPLTLLGQGLPLPRAAGFVAALRVLVALIFTFLGLRRLGFYGGRALAGAFVYGLGFLMFWASWPVANVAAFLPMALYAALRCEDDSAEKNGVFLLALALAGLLLSGDPEATVCAGALLLLFLLARVRRRLAGTRRALLARTGTALLIAAAVSAPVILSTLFYMPKAVMPWSFARWQLLVPFGLGLAFLAAWGLERLRRRHRWLAAAMAIVLAMALVSVDLAVPANPPMPRRLAFPMTASLSAAHYSLGIRSAKGFRMGALGDILPPNLAGLYDVADVRIFNSMAPKAYVDFLKPIIAGSSGELQAPDDPLYQRLGVRFLLTRLDAKLPAVWKRFYADRTTALWEGAEAFPSFFLAAPHQAGRVLIKTTEDTGLSGVADLRRRQWLGTTVYQDGGWLLLLNGERQRTVPDATFVAARLPSGGTQLDLLYRPAGFVWGLMIAALGLVAGVTVFAPLPIRRPSRGGSLSSFRRP